jgi:Domain of unknown function (DUF4382)/Carboxypeptidase regulatory-like domain
MPWFQNSFATTKSGLLGRTKTWFIASLLAAVVVACGGGGSGGTGAPMGTLNVSLTDAPSCGYDHVYVTVEKVRVNQSDTAADEAGGWSEIVLAAPKRIDLLTLTNGVLEELGSTSLPAGKYKQIRLVLAANSASSPLANAVKPTSGSETALDTPSAQQSGLKLKTDFDVLEGQTVDIVLDFDACKSVVKAGNSGKYLLKPVLSVFKRVESGIQGYVAPALANGGTSVSAQQNGVVVRATAPNASGTFSITLLPDGTYTLVITAAGYQTGVITGVPVSASVGKTSVSTSSSTIALGTSTMSTLSGTVSAVVGTGTLPLTSATISVSQSLSAAGAVSLAQLPVNAQSAVYSVSLPRLAPLVGAYSAGTLPPALSADAAAAGLYRVTAQALAQTKSANVDVSAGDVTQSFEFP